MARGSRSPTSPIDPLIPLDGGTWALVSLIAGGAGLAILPWVTRWMRLRRRRLLVDQPVPAEWEELALRSWRLYGEMPDEVRSLLWSCVQVLLREKRFEACGGLEQVTGEMRVLILLQAALLLVGRPEEEHGFYPDLVSILIYPTAYRDRGQRTFSLREERSHDIRLGESWSSGSVVLSWESVQRGAAGAHDGVNVVFHEFAHQIDRQDGTVDGAPPFDEVEEAWHWSEVFQSRFEELVEQVERGGHSLLDEYGATDPAEFFAVATEAFFERATRMDREMPDLYDELADFYGLDPAAWPHHESTSG